MRTTVLVLTVALSVSTGCHYRAGAAISGIMSLSSTVDTDNPILVDAWGRVDSGIFQIEASYGYSSYTYDYETVTTTEQADLEILPLILTARAASSIFLVAVLLVPGAALVGALVVWWRRR